jgi:hypothetical protein
MHLDLTLFEVLKQHDCIKNKSVVEKCLGDGFLFEHNLLYRNLRTEFLKLNYTFTTEDFCHYIAMPFLSLPEILKHKKVPYFDNTTPVRLIETAHPKKFKCEDIIKPKTNHILHESSHCIADSILKMMKIKSAYLSAEQNTALEMIMAESFANTVESICNTWITTDVAKLFFEMNSYIVHYKKISQALTETIQLIGIKNSFALVYISYLFSNCLRNEISANDFSKIIQSYFNTPTSDLIIKNKCCAKIFNHAFELSMDFRLQTTGFFCQMSGLKADLFKLVDIDFPTLLSKTDLVQSFLKRSEHLLNK